MSRETESMRSLDKLAAPDVWLEIERRAEGPWPDIESIDTTSHHPLRRLGVSAVALSLFAGVALLTWLAFRPGAESEGSRPAADGAAVEAPAIRQTEAGYVLYSSRWLGWSWELLALESVDPELGCESNRYVVAYRDANGTSWQSCPDVSFSAQTFTGEVSSYADVADADGLIIGTVALDVSSITVETTDGRTVQGTIIPISSELGTDFNAFVIQVPGPWPGTIVARGTLDEVVQQRQNQPPPLQSDTSAG